METGCKYLLCAMESQIVIVQVVIDTLGLGCRIRAVCVHASQCGGERRGGDNQMVNPPPLATDSLSSKSR